LTGFIESLYIVTRLNIRLEVDMKVTSDRLRDNLFVAFVLVSFLFAFSGLAADYPAPNQGEWIVRDFRFHTGEVLPELRLHYTTVGAPSGEPVLILHGSTGAGTNMLNPNFAGELFGPGQPLDTSRYFIILPDALGAGKSSKPSDGLRTRFPKYNYDDIVQAQYRLVTEHLGVRRLRLVLGTSAGGMQTWVWGVTYPDFMEALVPLASQPVEVAGRNWITRRMLIDAIRNDPEWNGGNYPKQPRSLQTAQVYFSMATSGGTQALYKAAPTQDKADQLVNERLAQRSSADANDVIYQYEASRGYNPAPKIESIKARLLAINSADDERNPPELGILEREIKRVKNGRYVLIPGSEETRGHGTTGMAKLWKQHLAELLQPAVQAAK
jgi:homoserine O-acetyltransferase/O-succinyltransferase